MTASRGLRATTSRRRVPFFRPSIGREEIEEVIDTLKSGHLTSGPKAARFEKDFARFVGAPYAVALSSATAALHLALEAVGTQPGDLVIVPTMTFAATAEVIRHFGATPVFVDCDAATYCISPSALEKTLDGLKAGRASAGLKPPYGPLRAIITMHYGGQMVDVEPIRGLAHRAGVPVIEDASHAFPSYYRASDKEEWQSAGTTGDISCFSFYANKSITTGEGGMAVTLNEEWANRIRLMSWHGITRGDDRFTSNRSWNYDVVDAGYKYNMSDVAASIGVRQLKKANSLWQARKRVAKRYLKDLGALGLFDLPVELPGRKHAWHLFALRLKSGAWKIGRDDFVNGLTERGIGTSVHWRPLHMHSYYREKYGYAEKDFPVAASVWPHLVSLPMFPDMVDEDIEAVVDAITDIARTGKR